MAANILIVSQTLDIFQHRAIALSTSVTMIFNFVFLSAVLYRKVGGYDLSYLVRSLLKITLASLAMGGLSYYFYRGLGEFWGRQNLISQAATLLIVIAVAVPFYFTAIRLLGIREFKEVLEKLKGKLLKAPPV